MDHTEFAGPTLADIAREKAGIIKPTSAAIIGETEPELVDIFEAAGAATTFVRGQDFETTSSRLAVGGRLLDLRTPTTIYPDVLPAAARRPPGRQRDPRPDRGRDVLRRAARHRGGDGGLRRREDARPVRGARPPAAHHRRRCPQPVRRRHVRAGVLRGLRARRPAHPRHRHPARPDGDARRAARRRVRHRVRLHRAVTRGVPGGRRGRGGTQARLRQRRPSSTRSRTPAPGRWSTPTATTPCWPPVSLYTVGAARPVLQRYAN